MRGVDDAIRDARARADLRGIDDDARVGLRFGHRHRRTRSEQDKECGDDDREELLHRRAHSRRTSTTGSSDLKTSRGWFLPVGRMKIGAVFTSRLMTSDAACRFPCAALPAPSCTRFTGRALAHSIRGWFVIAMPLTADELKWQLFSSPGSPEPHFFTNKSSGSTREKKKSASNCSSGTTKFGPGSTVVQPASATTRRPRGQARTGPNINGLFGLRRESAARRGCDPTAVRSPARVLEVAAALARR